jgi:hypothetical protein
MARHERLDHGICQRMCNLPTKQNKHSPTSHSPLPHLSPRGCTSLPTNSNGPYHRTPAKQWERCNSHHCRPWMLTCSSLPAMQHHYHRSRDCTALPPTHLQMVWTAKRIISDRDPRITSHFGKALVQKLGISQNLSTTAHPQTDGLSERKNQWVEQYLRLVTSLEPETWANWLPLATLVHNNRQNATTKVSPSQALLGYEPDEITLPQRPSNSQDVEDRAAAMTQFRKTAITALNATAQRSPAPEAQFKLRDQVWLEGTNLRLPHQASKLAPKRYGPFQIIQEISPVAYRLELPAAWNIHNVFHASLLTPYLETTAHGPNYAKPPPDLIEGEEEYEVERITKHRYFGQDKEAPIPHQMEGLPRLRQHMGTRSKPTCCRRDPGLLGQNQGGT